MCTNPLPSKDKNKYLLLQVSVRYLKKVKVRIKKNVVYYIGNSYLNTKRLIKEFLKRIVLILGLKQVSFLRF